MADDSVTPVPSVVTRKDALAAGLKYYFTGKPCPKGHIAQHYVGGGCIVCSRERTRVSNRESYRTNPEFRQKSLDTSRKRRERVRGDPEEQKKERTRKREAARKAREKPGVLAQEAEKMREYRKNPRVKKKIKAYKKKYAASPENRELINSAARAWRRVAKSDPARVEKERARGRRRIKDDPLGNRVRRHRYRAKIKGNGGRHTVKDIAHILSQQKYKCIYCFTVIRDAYEVDHIMPIALGGSNWPSNLQCTCRCCNRSKGAKHPFDFAKEKGRLL